MSIVGTERLTQFDQMFFGVPEVEDALGTREVLAKELFQAGAAIGQRDLLLGFVPTDLRRLPAQLQTEFVKLVKPR